MPCSPSKMYCSFAQNILPIYSGFYQASQWVRVIDIGPTSITAQGLPQCKYASVSVFKWI